MDRRSHEKFIESSNQIGLLVDKFKLEGNSFLRLKVPSIIEDSTSRGTSVTPLHAFGKPSICSKIGTLMMFVKIQICQQEKRLAKLIFVVVSISGEIMRRHSSLVFKAFTTCSFNCSFYPFCSF